MNASFQLKSPRAISSVLYGVAVGTVVVALLDATDGVIYFWLTAARCGVSIRPLGPKLPHLPVRKQW